MFRKYSRSCLIRSAAVGLGSGEKKLFGDSTASFLASASLLVAWQSLLYIRPVPLNLRPALRDAYLIDGDLCSVSSAIVLLYTVLRPLLGVSSMSRSPLFAP